MPIPLASRQFDTIATQYDETREPMDPPVFDALLGKLEGRGIHSLLEIGVGTGRVAFPLRAARIGVSGVDASREMLTRARSKGPLPLVRGDAYRLPFVARAFDASLFVHVLHLLDDPRHALIEAVRASRTGAMAVVRPFDSEDGDRRVEEPRRIVYRELARAGYPTPDRGGGPGVHERKILREIPPDEVEILDDRSVTQPLDRQLRFLERGASRHTAHVPRDVLAAAVATARQEIGTESITFRRTEALATWSTPPGAGRTPTP